MELKNEKILIEKGSLEWKQEKQVDQQKVSRGLVKQSAEKICRQVHTGNENSIETLIHPFKNTFQKSAK